MLSCQSNKKVEKSMKVLLQQDVAKLGRDGEIVNVADGYARNYLFPRQLALPAIGGVLKAHQARLAATERKDAQLLAQAQQDAASLEGKTVQVPARAGDSGRLYGSITAQDIADAIKNGLGVNVDRRKIQMPDPIRTVSTTQVPVKLYKDVATTVTVEVVTRQTA